MKAERIQEPKKFIPVILTLETQDEVDSIYSLFNHNGICNTAGLPFKSFEVLDAYQNEKATDQIHQKLVRLVEGK